MRTTRWAFVLMAGMAFPLGTTSAQQRPAQRPAVDSRASDMRVGDTLVISRRQAIALAMRANPQMDVAREQTLQARAQRIEGISIADPVLTGSLDSLTGLRHLGAAPQRPIALSAGLPFPDKLRLRNSVGVANIQAFESAQLLVQQQLAAQAGRAYDSVLVVRLHQRDLLQSRELAAEFLKRTEARFNAGSVPRLDVIKAQVDLAQADNDLIGNRRDLANADAALNRVLGRPLGSSIAPSDSLTVPDGLPGLDAVEEIALRVRPELRAVEAQQRGAHSNSALVREQAFLPDVTVGAGRDEAVPSGFVLTLGFSLPIPLMFWQHTHGEFAETYHRERELAASYRDVRAAVAQDVRTSWATADAALRQVVFLRDQLLPAAREAYRISSVSYALGGLSALEVLDARRTLLSAQSQYADALAAANSSRSDLERAAGAPLSTLNTGANRE
jgi:cobalt-zinc-cadmium efflux system outer membrane protein